MHEFVLTEINKLPIKVLKRMVSEAYTKYHFSERKKKIKSHRLSMWIIS